MKDWTVILLKEIGLRVTPQRRAILELLKENGSHPSAETIYFALLKTHPSISFATVYNTLAKLAEAEKIQQLEIDPQRKRFDHCLTPHHHFYCKACGRIFDVLDDSFLLKNVHEPEFKDVDDHQVDSIQVYLKGLCKDCKK
jgi:Fe2+ or Zn2+ uptake regulation protein